MATAKPILIWNLLLHCGRDFATDTRVCSEGSEWSRAKGSCLDCGQGYYRSWCMSACEKCAEPTNSYEQVWRDCTVTRNSFVACKDDADAKDRLCTPSNAVQSDCDGATDPLAITTARTQETTGTTLQVAKTAPTATSSERTSVAFRSMQTFSSDLKSRLPINVEEPSSKSSVPGGRTMVGEQDKNENVEDYHEEFVAVYLLSVVATVGAMVAVPLLPCLVQNRDIL